MPLLGGPLFTGQVLDEAWSARCEDLTRAIQRLKLIHAQNALILLHASFSAPKVQHLMRCSPSVDNKHLAEFDNLLRSAVVNIANTNLSDDQWLQASLPISMGGLGVRRVTSLALPAFLASAASTKELQDTILSRTECNEDQFFLHHSCQSGRLMQGQQYCHNTCHQSSHSGTIQDSSRIMQE